MKKNLIVALLLFLFSANGLSQTTFQKNLGIQFDTTFIRCQSDGNAVFVAGQFTQSTQLVVHFLKFDGSGTLLWSKKYYADNTSYSLKSFILQGNDVLALINGKKDAFLMKLAQQDGAMLWHKRLGNGENLQIFEVACDDKQQIWMSGLHLKASEADSNYYVQIKTDRNAVPLLSVQTRFVISSTNFRDTRLFRASNLIWEKSSQKMIAIQDYFGEYVRQNDVFYGDTRRQFAVSDSNLKYNEYVYPDDIFDWVITKNNIAFSAMEGGLDKRFLIGLLNKNASRYVQLRATDGKMQSIHNNDGSIVFYNYKYKTLTKYNELLQPFWTKKYDNCFNTYAFAADIAADGSIFTVRNMDNRTILSRINADGTLPACIDYDDLPRQNKDTSAVGLAITYGVQTFDYRLPIVKDSTKLLVDVPTNSTPFCLKINARFNLPDTVCVNSTFKPTNVDTAFAKHSWEFRPSFSDSSFPVINYALAGQKRVFHLLTKGVCQDSSSSVVTVILEPVVNARDTVICGGKNVEINLTTPNANGYFVNNQRIKPNLTIDSSGIFNFKITTKGCATEKKIKVKINDFTIPDFKQNWAALRQRSLSDCVR
jgi:hypothetical protein